MKNRIYGNWQQWTIDAAARASRTMHCAITFTINREGDPDHVLTSVELSRETRPQRTVSLTAAQDTSELLHDELEITGHDYLFEQTLQEVAELLG